MRLLRCLVVVLSIAGTCSAQLPDYYKTVNRVTWVVRNIDKVRPAWEALGLSDIQEYPNIQLVGEFRGKPVTIYAWQITGHLGNLTVDMIQPAEGQANAYTNFLGKHGDGILSIVHEVPDQQTLEKEILRMKRKGRRYIAAGDGAARPGAGDLYLFRYGARGEICAGTGVRVRRNAQPRPGPLWYRTSAR